MTFTKLFSSITESSVWVADDHTRLMWITMLAMADKYGRVFGSIPGVANRARVPVESAERAIEAFLSPDQYSRTVEHDGRRIEKIDGGWRLLNYLKYRAIRDEEHRREQNREAKRRQRAVEAKSAKSSTVSHGHPTGHPIAEAEAEAEAYTDQRKEGGASLPASADIEQVFNSWNAEAESSKLPKCLLISDKRRRILEARLREPFFVSNWQAAIAKVGASNFCKGDNNRSWKAGFDWFISPDSVTKLIEGKYDNGTHKPSSAKSFDRNKGTLNEGLAPNYKAKPVATPPVV